MDLSVFEPNFIQQEKMGNILRRFRLKLQEGSQNKIFLLRDMNMLWNQTSIKSKIAEVDFSKNFTSKALIDWLKTLYPLLNTEMKSQGFHWMSEIEWNWFLVENISKSLKRRSGVVFIARKKVLFIEDSLVLKIITNDRTARK